jgi:hypothetical protein
MEACPTCSSDEVREIFKVAGQHQPLHLVRRCETCGHEWPVEFAGDTKWLFLPPQKHHQGGKALGASRPVSN